MKKFPALLILLLCILAFLPGRAEEKIPASRSEINDVVVMYVFPDGVPQGVKTSKEIGGDRLYYEPEGEERVVEYVKKIDYTFVSGDERLKAGACTGETSYASPDEDASSVSFEFDPEAVSIDEPAYAVFHLSMETRHHTFEQDVTICCVPWNGYECFEIPGNQTLAYHIAPEQKYIVGHDVFEACLKGNDTALLQRLRERFPEIFPPDKEPRMFEFNLGIPDLWLWVVEANTPQVSQVNKLVVRGMGVILQIPLWMGPFPYELTGGTTIYAGETLSIGLNEKDHAGRNFIWSVKGDGAEILESGNTGAVLSASAEAKGPFTLSVTADDSRQSLVTEITVVNGVFGTAEWTDDYGRDGFSVTMPTGDEWHSRSMGTDQFCYCEQVHYDVKENGEYSVAILAEIYCECYVFETGLMEDPEKAAEWLKTYYMSEPEENETFEIFEMDGHPALYDLATGLEYNGSKYSYAGIYYPRNNRLMRIRCYFYEGAPVPSLRDLQFLAGHIGYDPEKAPLKASDAAITVTPAGDGATMTAGAKMAFTAAFANPEIINQKNKNDAVSWKVTDTATGEAPSFAKISKGALTVDKKLDHIAELEIAAISDVYQTAGSCRVTVLPQLKGLKADPAEIVFYTGTSAPVTLKITADPDALTLTDCAFAAAKSGIVDIADNGDGTAVVSLLSAGKTEINIQAGGKKTKVKVLCADPVTAAEIAVKGKCVPGGTVTCSAKLTPAKPAVPAVQWSVDVDESVAAIDEKGRLKIRKEAPAGTVIHVTCTALGAPEPVTATAEITVEAK